VWKWRIPERIVPDEQHVKTPL